MKPAVSMLGIGILVLSAVVIGSLLQVAPTPDSVLLAKNDASGNLFSDSWPHSSGNLPGTSTEARASGISVKLKLPGTQGGGTSGSYSFYWPLPRGPDGGAGERDQREAQAPGTRGTGSGRSVVRYRQARLGTRWCPGFRRHGPRG